MITLSDLKDIEHSLEEFIERSEVASDSWPPARGHVFKAIEHLRWAQLWITDSNAACAARDTRV